MPLTDTDFTGKNEAKRLSDLEKLMKSVKEKEDESYKKLAVVILAAGLGKRMKSPDKPKVMFELAGRPMIEYVFETALMLEPDLIVPIVGHHRELVIDHLEAYIKEQNVDPSRLKFAVQEEQLGTGHAVIQTEPFLHDFSGEILILSGDTPLISFETAEMLINKHLEDNNLATLLTAEVDDPYGYGRIVRDEKGRFLQIVEEKDATEEQRKLNEINAAIYIVNSKYLYDALKKISPENNQKEYYLTDIFHFIPKENTGTVLVDNELEILGVNSIEQLQEMESIIRSTE